MSSLQTKHFYACYPSETASTDTWKQNLRHNGCLVLLFKSLTFLETQALQLLDMRYRSLYTRMKVNLLQLSWIYPITIDLLSHWKMSLLWWFHAFNQTGGTSSPPSRTSSFKNIIHGDTSIMSCSRLGCWNTPTVIVTLTQIPNENN